MDACSSSSRMLARALTAPTPRSLWIELTSVCPYDCVFCSRRFRRGAGEHLDFAVFERIVAQLDRPEVIRLNYSGESMHYPKLPEALRVAKRSGAQLELVTALGSAPRRHLEALRDEGLDRLTISLHAIDAQAYQDIYRHSSVDKLLAAIDALGPLDSGPAVDLSFVAMERNLDELEKLALFARERGISSIAVHPVIRRDLIPIRFDVELDDAGELRTDFRQRVELAAAAARELAPEVAIEVARPVKHARHAAGPGFATCEQNPWETMHVLASGDAVVCEVLDHVSMGSLAEHGLRDVWLGETYESFRERYLENREETCAKCDWYQFQPRATRDPVWLTGWHPRGPGDTLHWAAERASVWIPTGKTEARFGLDGVIPQGVERVAVYADGLRVGVLRNETGKMATVEFSAHLPVVADRSGGVLFTFEASSTVRPPGDLRRLGFGLRSLEIDPPGKVRASSRWKELAAGPLVKLARKVKVPRLAVGEAGQSVTVVIPECGTPEVLGECLTALSRSEAVADSVLVWVNGAAAERYRDLQAAYPWARFEFTPARQGFSGAVCSALEQVRSPWTFLLNSDALVEPAALGEVLRQRAPDVFAVASQLEAWDENERRVESNWNRLEVRDGLVELWDAYPVPDQAVDIPYAGGTAALYRTDTLRLLASDSQCYDPFYWEDVEWGVCARAMGLRCVLAPRSRVRHLRRATVNRWYEVGEVERIFERNRLLFQLRNGLGNPAAVSRALGRAPWRTIQDLYGNR